jgi:putative membrane protein
MVRLAARATVAVLANAVALIATSLILDDVALDTEGFVIAVVVFTVTEMLVQPLIRQTAMKSAPSLLGSSALIATLASLIVTVLLNDGMRITGGVTWVLATVMIWAVSLVAQLLLPLVIFKRVLSRTADSRG